MSDEFLKGKMLYPASLVKNFQNAGLYFLGSIVQSVLALFAQPIYSIYLSAEDFGIIGYFEAIKNVFTPIFILSMTSVFLMKYFHQGDTENKKLMFNLTFYLACLNTLTIFLGYVIIYLYFKALSVNVPIYPFAWLILVSLLLENFKTAVLINYRIRKKALAFFVFSLVGSLLNVGLGLLFVAAFQWGAEGRLLAPVIAVAVMLPICLIILKQFTIPDFNPGLFLKSFRIALPLILASYAYVPIVNVDRFFLERLNNLSELGLYNIGITIASYVQLAYVALALAFEPDIFKSVAERNNANLIKTGILMFAPYLIVVVILEFSSGIIIDFLTAGQYIAAEHYVNIIMVSVFLMSVFGFFDKIFVALGKTRFSLIVNTIGGIVAIVIMYFAVEMFSFIGAAYGKIVIAVLMIAVAAVLAIPQLKVNYIKA